MTKNDKWLVDAFRCATLQKDWALEAEIYYINQEKKKVYEAKSN